MNQLIKPSLRFLLLISILCLPFLPVATYGLETFVFIQCSLDGDVHPGKLLYSSTASEFICENNKLVGKIQINLEFKDIKYSGPMIHSEFSCNNWPYGWYTISNQYGFEAKIKFDYSKINGDYRLFPVRIVSDTGTCAIREKSELEIKL